MTYADHRKVTVGNLLLRWSVRMFRLCIQHHVPIVLENPYSSMAWELPPMRRLMSTPGLHGVSLDYCQFGELWKKPTYLIYYNIDISDLEKQCHSHRGRCSRTKRPHIPLVGVDADGLFMTLKAQPYPWAMCSQLAKCVAKALRDQGLGVRPF